MMTPATRSRAHYVGLFLTDDAKRAVANVLNVVRGSSHAPEGCKSSADHATCAYAPTRASIEAYDLDRRRDDVYVMRMTHIACCDAINALVIAIDVDDWVVPFDVATPHVSVFVDARASWGECHDVITRALARGEAMDLRAIDWLELTIEGTIGVMMVRDDGERWVARTTREALDGEARASDGVERSACDFDVKAWEDIDDVAREEREYMELCEMFEGECVEWIHDAYVESGRAKDVAAERIEVALIARELSDVPHASSSSRAKRDSMAMNKREVVKETIRMGSSLTESRRNFGDGAGVGAYFKSDGPAIRGRLDVECAVGKWKTLQGERARSVLAAQRAANAVVKEAWVAELSEDLEKLRLRRKKGKDNEELEKRIRDKYNQRVALERLSIAKTTPTLDDEAEFNVVLDFHGYTRAEAVRALEAELIRTGPLVTSTWSMKLITGRGIHSAGGPVIHKVLKSWLDQFGVAYEEYPSSGHIVVRADASVLGTKVRK